jgi:hypothetical protein
MKFKTLDTVVLETCRSSGSGKVIWGLLCKSTNLTASRSSL